MPSEIILYGPDSEAFSTYAPVSPAPSGGPVTTASTPVFPAAAPPSYRYIRPLGTQLVMQDGRKFRFSQAGGVALVVGNTIQSAAILSTDIDMTPLTGTLPTGFGGGGTVGDRGITFTHGAATTIINFFAEGFITVTITPGIGDAYKVASHIALASAAAGDQVNLWPGHAIRRALTSSSRVTLTQHPYGNVIQVPVTTLTGIPVGVAVAAMAANTTATNLSSGWIQTRGLANVLTNGTLIIGEPATVPPTGVGGACSPYAAGAAETGVQIGTVLSVEATTQASPIFLTIDG